MKITIVAILSALALSACSFTSKKPSLYYWGDYSSLQFQSFDETSSLEEQIQAMENYFNKAHAQQARIAPGAYAHLGMLYAKNGNLAEAKKQFEIEKKQFPESGHYMDFLKANMNKGSSK